MGIVVAQRIYDMVRNSADGYESNRVNAQAAADDYEAQRIEWEVVLDSVQAEPGISADSRPAVDAVVLSQILSNVSSSIINRDNTLSQAAQHTFYRDAWQSLLDLIEAPAPVTGP